MVGLNFICYKKIIFPLSPSTLIYDERIKKSSFVQERQPSLQSFFVDVVVVSFMQCIRVQSVAHQFFNADLSVRVELDNKHDHV